MVYLHSSYTSNPTFLPLFCSKKATNSGFYSQVPEHSSSSFHLLLHLLSLTSLLLLQVLPLHLKLYFQRKFVWKGRAHNRCFLGHWRGNMPCHLKIDLVWNIDLASFIMFFFPIILYCYNLVCTTIPHILNLV